MRLACLLIVLLAALPVQAGPITWADWTSQPTANLVNGVVGPVQVTMTAPSLTATLAAGTGVANLWAIGASSYSATLDVPNAPTTPDHVGVSVAGVHTITFTPPARNPVLAVLSLGRVGIPARYNFGTMEFHIFKSGPGHYGNGSLEKSIDPLTGAYLLTGREGNGIIQFYGTFGSISWNHDIPELGSAITVGVNFSPPEGRFLLTWEPPPVAPDAGPVGYYSIYSGRGATCSAATPLPTLLTRPAGVGGVADVPATALTYLATMTPISEGPVCFEATASNAAGESGRSNRATALVDPDAPPTPTSVTIARTP
jgi:hypothetical protein